MKILHLADLHLGRSSIEPKARARRMNALRNAISEARRFDVDAIVVAGDVFDSPNVDSQVVRLAAKTFDSATNSNGDPVPVIIISGNHDPSDSNELWSRFQSALPSNSSVQLALLPKIFNLCEGRLCIEAYPNEYRWSPNSPWHSRLDISGLTPNATRVVVSHGTLQGGKVPIGDSDSYPFTMEDVESLAADYVALGHFHSTYPGWERDDETERRSVSFAGTHEPDRFGQDSGYVLLVEFESSRKAVVKRIPVAVSDWRMVKIGSANDLGDLRNLASAVESSDDPSRFVVRVQSEEGVSLTAEQLQEIERLLASLEALGVDVNQRGVFELSLDMDDLDFDSLPTGAVAETIVELKAELQTSSDELLLPVIREAIQLGWLHISQER